jgi:hypothetical protein
MIASPLKKLSHMAGLLEILEMLFEIAEMMLG